MYDADYGMNPGMFMQLLRNRGGGGGFMSRFRQPGPSPEEMAMMGDYGRAHPMAYNRYLAHQRHQAALAHMANSAGFAPNFGGDFAGSEFGQDAMYGVVYGAFEEEDEDEFGADADAEEEDADADPDVYSGAKRLRRILKRSESKGDKWSNRANKNSGIWKLKPMKGLAERKAGKFDRKSRRISGKLAAKEGRQGGARAGGRAGGGFGGGGYSQIFDGAPPRAGQQARLFLYPSTAPSGDWAGDVSNPVVVGTIGATPATQTTTIVLQTKAVTYAKYLITGFEFNLKGAEAGATVLAKDLKVQGRSGLFITDDYQDLEEYDPALNRTVGLRNQDIIQTNNFAQVTVLVDGPSDAVARFSCALVVDILEDTVAPEGQPNIQRRAGPWA